MFETVFGLLFCWFLALFSLGLVIAAFRMARKDYLQIVGLQILLMGVFIGYFSWLGLFIHYGIIKY